RPVTGPALLTIFPNLTELCLRRVNQPLDLSGFQNLTSVNLCLVKHSSLYPSHQVACVHISGKKEVTMQAARSKLVRCCSVASKSQAHSNRSARKCLSTRCLSPPRKCFLPICCKIS